MSVHGPQKNETSMETPCLPNDTLHRNIVGKMAETFFEVKEGKRRLSNCILFRQVSMSYLNGTGEILLD
jgi:hypothetical protein